MAATRYIKMQDSSALYWTPVPYESLMKVLNAYMDVEGVEHLGQDNIKFPIPGLNVELVRSPQGGYVLHFYPDRNSVLFLASAVSRNPYARIDTEVGGYPLAQVELYGRTQLHRDPATDHYHEVYWNFDLLFRKKMGKVCPHWDKSYFVGFYAYPYEHVPEHYLKRSILAERSYTSIPEHMRPSVRARVYEPRVK